MISGVRLAVNDNISILTIRRRMISRLCLPAPSHFISPGHGFSKKFFFFNFSNFLLSINLSKKKKKKKTPASLPPPLPVFHLSIPPSPPIPPLTAGTKRAAFPGCLQLPEELEIPGHEGLATRMAGRLLTHYIVQQVSN